MTRSKTITAALAAVLLSLAAAPASAVAIRHTNRAEGDPAVALLPTGHTPPPADMREAHALDKVHDGGTAR